MQLHTPPNPSQHHMSLENLTADSQKKNKLEQQERGEAFENI